MSADLDACGGVARPTCRAEPPTHQYTLVMRIIAGTHRGRSILPPKDDEVTRPMVDRVKEALFSRLMSLGMLETDPDAPGYGPFRVLDIFCGTGSLGLECLSRGAEHVTFVDRDRDAVQRLETNLASLKETHKADVLNTSALTPAWATRLGEGSIRLTFLDPPYAMMKDPANRLRLDQVMQVLLPKLEPGGVLVLRTHEEDPPLAAEGYDGPSSFRYGTMVLHFYQRPMPDPSPDAPPDEA